MLPKSIGRKGDVLNVAFDDAKPGDIQWLMITGDRHHDSTRCNRELEKEQLDLALKRKALIFDVGDMFDAMQGRYDPRRTYEEIRPEYKTETYFTDIVRYASEDYQKYAKIWAMMGTGNHEETVRKNNQRDLASDLIAKLEEKTGSPIYAGGLSGFVVFTFKISTQRKRIVMYYHHGAGGAAPVTKGTIQSNRQATYLKDADIVVNAHTHTSWVLPLVKIGVNRKYQFERTIQWYLRTPGYHDGYGDGKRGHANEKWQDPKPMGCVWVRLRIEPGQNRWVSVEAFPDVR